MHYYGKFWSTIHSEGYVNGKIEIMFTPEDDQDLQKISIIFSYIGEYFNGTTLEFTDIVEKPVDNFWINIGENYRMKIEITHFDFHIIKAEYTLDNPFDNGLIYVSQLDEPER